MRGRETLLSICLGLGLSAACGFRVFIPLLAMSIASLSGHMTLSQGFEWIGTYPAFLAFAAAAVALSKSPCFIAPLEPADPLSRTAMGK